MRPFLILPKNMLTATNPPNDNLVTENKTMECPYCNAPQVDCVPAVAIYHAEHYGDGHKNFACMKCGKIVGASFSRQVTVSDAIKSDQESDWACQVHDVHDGDNSDDDKKQDNQTAGWFNVIRRMRKNKG